AVILSLNSAAYTIQGRYARFPEEVGQNQSERGLARAVVTSDTPRAVTRFRPQSIEDAGEHIHQWTRHDIVPERLGVVEVALQMGRSKVPARNVEQIRDLWPHARARQRGRGRRRADVREVLTHGRPPRHRWRLRSSSAQ